MASIKGSDGAEAAAFQIPDKSGDGSTDDGLARSLAPSLFRSFSSGMGNCKRNLMDNAASLSQQFSSFFLYSFFRHRLDPKLQVTRAKLN